MKVSIIIPVRNGAKFLRECLKSIVNQTYTNWELIVVNDNSTDNTISILKQFTKLDKRITWVNSKGIGIIEALKTGYSLSTGELITRMDADDIKFQNNLEILVNNLLKSGRGFLATGCVAYFSETELGEGYKFYAKLRLK